MGIVKKNISIKQNKAERYHSYIKLIDKYHSKDYDIPQLFEKILALENTFSRLDTLKELKDIYNKYEILKNPNRTHTTAKEVFDTYYDILNLSVQNNKTLKNQ